MILPDEKTFRRLARRYPRVPVAVEGLADEVTPLGLFRAFQGQSPHCFLLESVEGGEHLGRYSFLASATEEILRLKGSTWWREVKGRRVKQESGDPLVYLRQRFAERRAPAIPGLPRFSGGAVGYLGYDVARQFEKLPSHTPPAEKAWDAVLCFPRELVVFDHVAHTVRLIRSVPSPAPSEAGRVYRATVRDLKRRAGALRSAASSLHPFPVVDRRVLPELPGERAKFKRAVARVKEYVAQGDIIQAVLSRRRSVPVRAPALEIYRALRRINPSPYLFFFQDGDTRIIGSSPEMLVRLEGTRAETRPIAGTRPRGSTPETDEALAKDLLADVKERAEHVMLVDLARNDLGRVCRPGSVRVGDFMTVERYSHVMHIVSSVTGRLSPGRDALDLLRATFPAGTLSGAPKIRAMEIIEELEPQRRGVYGGALGYWSHTGNMDMAIAIRTLVLEGSRAHLQAGAGIVADSDPDKEFDETQNKMAVLAAALRAAGEKL